MNEFGIGKWMSALSSEIFFFYGLRAQLHMTLAKIKTRGFFLLTCYLTMQYARVLRVIRVITGFAAADIDPKWG